MNKTRIWDNIRNFMWEPEDVMVAHDGTIWDNPPQMRLDNEPTPWLKDETECATIMKSTDLLARNGEIYEGDIVRFVQKDGNEIIFQDIGIVKYHHAAFIVDGSNWEKDTYYLGDYVVDGNLTELEIIGNVLENPEIIEKSNK
jgi:uncharacterized phage protein (TIGR01671 family)